MRKRKEPLTAKKLAFLRKQQSQANVKFGIGGREKAVKPVTRVPLKFLETKE